MSVTTTKHGPVPSGLRPQSFTELTQFANMAAKSSMVPAAFRNKPEDIVLAVQMGSELGLSPMQALQNIAVINNRPSVWGDAMPGLCRASAVCEDIIERTSGEGDKLTATCIAKRYGSEPVIVSFSVEDAKKAGLWGKAGPWTQYPKRMLQMRARGFALRDAFPDVLRGLIAAEEAQDMPNGNAPPPGPVVDSTAERMPEGTRDAINAAVPLSEAPPVDRDAKITAWLDALAARLDAAQAPAEVDAIGAEPATQKAQERLPEAHLARFNAMFAAAIERVAALADTDGDGWPGPDADAVARGAA